MARLGIYLEVKLRGLASRLDLGLGGGAEDTLRFWLSTWKDRGSTYRPAPRRLSRRHPGSMVWGT